jgi:hypothetical protein
MLVTSTPSGAKVEMACITITLDQPVKPDDPAGFTSTDGAA